MRDPIAARDSAPSTNDASQTTPPVEEVLQNGGIPMIAMIPEEVFAVSQPLSLALMIQRANEELLLGHRRMQIPEHLADAVAEAFQASGWIVSIDRLSNLSPKLEFRRPPQRISIRRSGDSSG